MPRVAPRPYLGANRGLQGIECAVEHARQATRAEIAEFRTIGIQLVEIITRQLETERVFHCALRHAHRPARQQGADRKTFAGMQFPGVVIAARLDFATHLSLLDDEEPLGGALGRIGNGLALGKKSQLYTLGEKPEMGGRHEIERRMALQKFDDRGQYGLSDVCRATGFEILHGRSIHRTWRTAAVVGTIRKRHTRTSSR
jgi:hypothetical protein